MASDPDLRRTADALVPVLYEDLRRIARHARWRVASGGTLQTTALVNEAYLRLRRGDGFHDAAHFLRAASIAMRQILLNAARAVATGKRGNGQAAVPLDDVPEMADDDAHWLLEIGDALDRLATASPRLADVVECRFFGGLTDAQTAQALGLNERTVRRDWLKARAWLRVQIGETGEAG